MHPCNLSVRRYPGTYFKNHESPLMVLSPNWLYAEGKCHYQALKVFFYFYFFSGGKLLQCLGWWYQLRELSSDWRQSSAFSCAKPLIVVILCRAPKCVKPQKFISIPYPILWTVSSYNPFNKEKGNFNQSSKCCWEKAVPLREVASAPGWVTTALPLDGEVLFTLNQSHVPHSTSPMQSMKGFPAHVECSPLWGL